MTLFKMSEFIDVAIRDEETGIAFYKALAEVTKNAKIKEGFQQIAGQELIHASLFRDMLAPIGEFKPHEEYPGQYENYLQTLIESRAFQTPEKAAAAAKAITSDVAALETAMRLEKETLLFLNELRGFIPAAQKKAIGQIMDEERGHLKDLVDLKKHL